MSCCGCGCGTALPDGRSYVHNHHRRGKFNTWIIRPVEEIDQSTTHKRSRKIKAADRDHCEWATIGGCKGPIDTAHVDGNDRNNDESNLRCLCRSHHALLDRGHIDPASPVMPPFRVSPGGKRRYEFA